MKRQWRIQRQWLAAPDGQRRWDRAYQHLLSWSQPDAPAAPAAPADGYHTAEVAHEHRDLRAGVDAAAGAGADD